MFLSKQKNPYYTTVQMVKLSVSQAVPKAHMGSSPA